MATVHVGERKPEGWSLVAGRFKGTDKTYFYVIRGSLMCEPPLTLQCPAAEDGWVYSNPFTIENVLARFGPNVIQDMMLKLGRSLPAKRDLRILVGDELRNVTTGYLWSGISFVKNNPKLKEAVEDWKRTWFGEAATNTITVKNTFTVHELNELNELKGDQHDMGMNCSCKNEGPMGALREVLFYWHDEVHDRIGEIVGCETKAVREASAKKTFTERMAADIVEFERQGNEDKWDAEARARRYDRLCSLLMDWVEMPQVEVDQIHELDRHLKAARDRLEAEFESLFVRAKVVRPGDEIEWLRAVGVYGENGDNFDIEGDARRFILLTANAPKVGHAPVEF